MKRFLSCLLVLALIFSLSGCGVFTMLKKAGSAKDDTAAAAPTQMPTEPETTAEPDTQPDTPDPAVIDENLEDPDLFGSIRHHYLSVDKKGKDGNPLAECIYPEFVFDDKAREAYPTLCSIVDEMFTGSMDRTTAVSTLAMFVREIENEDLPEETCWDYKTLYIARADEKIFSYYVETENRDPYGSEYQYYSVENLVSDTGMNLFIDEVVTDTDKLTELILEELTDEKTGRNVSSDASLTEGCRQLVEDYLEYDWLDFVLFEDGMRVLFAKDSFSNEHALYADISYADHPDLFTEAVQPVPVATPVNYRFPDEDPVNEIVSSSELEEYYGEYEENGEGANYFLIENPGWDGYYTADDVTDGGIAKLPYKIEKTKEDKSDWLNETEWADEQEIQLSENLPYDDGSFTYYVYNLEESIGLEIVEDVYEDEPAWSAFYDFSDYLDPPDKADEDDIFGEFTKLEIQYAVTDGNTVYVEIGHNTYASSQPHTSFIVALEADTGRLLWKSEELVASGYNFVIYGETIICGYGFTAEPDYLYVLNCHNGKKLETMKLRSAPYHFVLMGDTLYVTTYNTGYIFKLGS